MAVTRRSHFVPITVPGATKCGILLPITIEAIVVSAGKIDDYRLKDGKR